MELSNGFQPGKPVNVEACHNAPLDEVNPYICLKLKSKVNGNEDNGVIAYRDLSGNLVPFILFKIEKVEKANSLTYLLNHAYMMGLANSKGLYVLPNEKLSERIQKIVEEIV